MCTQLKLQGPHTRLVVVDGNSVAGFKSDAVFSMWSSEFIPEFGELESSF